MKYRQSLLEIRRNLIDEITKNLKTDYFRLSFLYDEEDLEEIEEDDKEEYFIVLDLPSFIVGKRENLHCAVNFIGFNRLSNGSLVVEGYDIDTGHEMETHITNLSTDELNEIYEFLTANKYI